MSPSAVFQDGQDIWYSCTGSSSYCGDYIFHVARHQNTSRMEYTNDVDTDGDPVSIWGMEQDTQMLPGDDNDYSTCNFAQDNNWYNHWSEVTQNWSRSDLSGLSNISYKPSQSETTEWDTSIGLSNSGITVTANPDHPRIKRTVQYEPNSRVKSVYDYDGYAGQDNNLVLGQVSTWISDRPSSGDRIAPSYSYGGFDGGNCQGNSLDTAGDSLFVFFNYNDF